eukprot:4020138-Pyramimonas_sp.AAC.1
MAKYSYKTPPRGQNSRFVLRLSKDSGLAPFPILGPPKTAHSAPRIEAIQTKRPPAQEDPRTAPAAS